MARKRQGNSGSIGKTTVIYKEVRKHLKEILHGEILALDPSSGSMLNSSGSLPGYAIYRAGVLEDSGVIDMRCTAELPYRLQELNTCLREQFSVPDVMVVEKIAARRYGGGSANSHASLLKAVGVTLAAIPCPRVVQIAPRQWKGLAHQGYKKSDEQDAIAIGHATIELARRIAENDPPRHYLAYLKEKGNE